MLVALPVLGADVVPAEHFYALEECRWYCTIKARPVKFNKGSILGCQALTHFLEATLEGTPATLAGMSICVQLGFQGWNLC